MNSRDNLIQKLTALGALANNPGATAAEVEAASEEVQAASADLVQYLTDNPPELAVDSKPEQTQPGVNAAAEGTDNDGAQAASTTTGDELEAAGDGTEGSDPLTTAAEAQAGGTLPTEGSEGNNDDGAPNSDAQVAAGTTEGEGTPAPQASNL